MIKRSAGEKVFNVFNVIFLAIIALSAVYPFMYSLSISLSNAADASKAGLHFFPNFAAIDLSSYKMVLKKDGLYTAYANTIFRTVVGTVLALIVTSMYAYALSRKNMPNRKFYSFILIFTMLFSGGQIPIYMNIKSLGLYNSMWVYILPNLITAYNAVVMRSFFVSIPESLHESAKIDGANEFTIYRKIIIPLSKPVIMTIALWCAVYHWNDWYSAKMFVDSNNDKVIVLQALLQKIILENDTALISQTMQNPDVTSYTSETVKSATILVSIIPILAMYPFIQKYFIKGVMLGAVKG